MGMEWDHWSRCGGRIGHTSLWCILLPLKRAESTTEALNKKRGRVTRQGTRTELELLVVQYRRGLENGGGFLNCLIDGPEMDCGEMDSSLRQSMIRVVFYFFNG